MKSHLRRRAWNLLLVGGLLATGQAAIGQIIPQDRRINWQPGIPGGVPQRTNILITLSAGASMTTIQAALNACPSNKVVKLAPGSYNLSGPLIIPSYVTLRGSGTNTVLNLASGGNGNGGVCFGAFNFSPWPANAPFTLITAGANAGSTNIIVASATNLAVGGYFVINELNDTSFVTPTNEYYPPADWCGGCGDGSPGSEDRLLGQILEVTSVNGNSIGFNPPLYFTYNPSLAPRCVPFANNFSAPAGQALVKWAGLESLKLYAVNGAAYGYNLVMNEAAYCWVKDIESDFAEGDHAMLNWCFRCEVRDSYFHDGFSHGPGTHDDAVKLGFKTTACLIENNIFWRLHTSFIGNYGCAGNVISYNFSTNTYHSSTTWQIMDFDFHNAHPSFNLFEGNIGVHWQPDSLHGSSSHSTCLRNWFTGANYFAPPIDARGPVQWSNGAWETAAATAFAVDYLTRTNNLVGNIAGCAQLVQTGGSFLSVAPSGRPTPVCFAFGYDGSLAPRDNGQTYDSTLLHGNYDFVTHSQHWDPTIVTHTIPDSYYLPTKPSWFGGCRWPPVDPNNPSALAVTNLPAAYRFVFGKAPASAASVNLPPTILARSTVAANTATFSTTGTYDPEGVLLTYHWTFGDGGISTDPNPTHNYPTNGKYKVELQVSDGFNTASSNLSLTIGP